MKKILLLLSFIFLVGCGSDKHQFDREEILLYMVTKAGNKLELKYIGPDQIIPEKYYLVTYGSYRYNSINYRCQLRTSMVAGRKNDINSKFDACNEISNLKLGDVVRLTKSYFERYSDGTLDYKSVTCHSCGLTSPERLLAASQLVLDNTELGTLSNRVAATETMIQMVDAKVDSNMDSTVKAVKKVHQKVVVNAQDIADIDNQASSNKQDIDKFKVMAKGTKHEKSRDRTAINSESKEISIKMSNQNKFGFLDEF